MLVDLHTHTTASDGKLKPSELVCMADKAGLSFLAITDHDTVSGIKEAKDTIKASNLSVSLVPGVELSIDSPGNEVHMLGLNIDPDNQKLKNRLHDFKEDREQRVYRIIDKLNALSYNVTIEDVVKQRAADTDTVGRPHIAAALVQKGYFGSLQDVFNKLLYFGGPAYETHLKPSMKEAIELIHEAKGLSIIAHPYGIKDQNIIEEAIKAGVDGIEVYYPEHTPEMMKHYHSMAKNYDLKISGGSDFHGTKGRFPKRLGIFVISVQLLNLW